MGQVLSVNWPWIVKYPLSYNGTSNSRRNWRDGRKDGERFLLLTEIYCELWTRTMSSFVRFRIWPSASFAVQNLSIASLPAQRHLECHEASWISDGEVKYKKVKLEAAHFILYSCRYVVLARTHPYTKADFFDWCTESSNSVWRV